MPVVSPVQTKLPSIAIVESVAAHEGVDPVDLEVPLYDVIDPDALDTLLQGASKDEPTEPLEIEFTYVGYDVTVTRDGAVHVTESG
ncbi:HalOD1 output domain-containing protein [Natrinema salaciae]|uniref:Halobacterial output domain-containing protein n=1 Tax=Natrinema salaciae TaxID=1186196 RepID=A0A1H9FRD8_9EURY|nr:HalOD1 output domain-containing protein [Natrinema salaciae]SEQ40490.1 hypothetical protein SAMN04489841_1656 [Natrinema salaciae]